MLPPGTDPGPHVFEPPLLDETSKEDPPEVRLAAAERTLGALPAPLAKLFTDGSATEGVRMGGAGYFIEVGGCSVQQYSSKN